MFHQWMYAGLFLGGLVVTLTHCVKVDWRQNNSQYFQMSLRSLCYRGPPIPVCPIGLFFF